MYGRYRSRASISPIPETRVRIRTRHVDAEVRVACPDARPEPTAQVVVQAAGSHPLEVGDVAAEGPAELDGVGDQRAVVDRQARHLGIQPEVVGEVDRVGAGVVLLRLDRKRQPGRYQPGQDNLDG